MLSLYLGADRFRHGQNRDDPLVISLKQLEFLAQTRRKVVCLEEEEASAVLASRKKNKSRRRSFEVSIGIWWCWFPGFEPPKEHIGLPVLLISYLRVAPRACAHR
jgi:hypothetical protein